MDEREQFLRLLRQYAPEGYLYVLARQSSTSKIEQIFVEGDDFTPVLSRINRLQKTHNIFIGMSAYDAKKATKDHALPGRLLWIDHDGPNAMPSTWDPAPAVAWKTSEGRYQALWILTEAIPIVEIEHHNAEMARKFGADNSGWDATQVLRLPGTLNHKHDPPTPVTYLWRREDVTEVERVPVGATAEPLPPSRDEAPDTCSREMALYLLGSYKVPTAVIAETFMGEHKDRSAALFKLMAQLFERGASMGDVFRIAHHSANQKFDTLQRLWADVIRTRTRVPTKAEAGWVLHHASELKDVSDEVGWVVNPFLYTDCVGTIVGEPSARKSWNALHLSAAVACDEVKDFLGKPVQDHGPVIYFYIDDQRERRLKLRLGNIVEFLTGERKYDIPLWWVNAGFNYNDSGWERHLVENLEEVEDKSGERVRMVVFDTLHRAGFDPKDFGTNAQPFLDTLGNIANNRHTAFMIVHHTTKNRETQTVNIRTAPWGSTFTGASLDPTWRLLRDHREDQEDPTKMHVLLEAWSKEGPEPPPILLAYGKEPGVFDVEVRDASLEQRIVNEIRRGKDSFNQAELVRRLGLPDYTVRAAVTALEQSGQIQKIKSGTQTLLTLPTNGADDETEEEGKQSEF